MRKLSPLLLAAATTLALVGATSAPAQAPKPKPAPKPTPAQAPAAPAAPAAPPQAAAPPLQFIPSPWVKLCEQQPKPICVTRSLLRTQNGAPAALAEFAEPEGAAKILRVTLPLGMLLDYGTRLLIDQGQQPVATARFVTCLEGCITFYQVSPDLQEKLKKGQTMIIQAVNLNNAAMSFPVPLTTFAKALEGAPTDPKVYEADQKRIQEELQKKAQAPK